jgi:hypothetical protein
MNCIHRGARAPHVIYSEISGALHTPAGEHHTKKADDAKQPSQASQNNTHSQRRHATPHLPTPPHHALDLSRTTRAPTSTHSIGFCVIRVCISSSSPPSLVTPVLSNAISSGRWDILFDFSPYRTRVTLFSELELELIQTRMTQKPMLWVEVGARALNKINSFA